MALHSDFRDLLAAFASEGVRYLIVGGYAVADHSRPRSTKDLGLWVTDDASIVDRVAVALARFGAPAHLVQAFREAGPDDIVFLGVPPVRIDILRRVDGLAFEDAYQRRVEVSWDGVPASLVGREDLIVNKRASGRPQDLRDVKALEKTR